MVVVGVLGALRAGGCALSREGGKGITLRQWWARYKARPTCAHEWELVKRYEVLDSGDGYPPGLNSPMRPVYISRCKLCGKRKTETRGL